MTAVFINVVFITTEIININAIITIVALTFISATTTIAIANATAIVSAIIIIIITIIFIIFIIINSVIVKVILTNFITIEFGGLVDFKLIWLFAIWDFHLIFSHEDPILDALDVDILFNKVVIAIIII